MNRILTVVLLLMSLWLGSCGDGPWVPRGVDPPVVSPLLSTTPENLLDNLSRAMNDRDKDLYATLIDSDFVFTEANCQGELTYENGRDQELMFLGGSHDGSLAGVFSWFRTLEFDFVLTSRTIEFGNDSLRAVVGERDGHFQEDWVVFGGRMMIFLVDANNDALRVDQGVSLKVRQASDGIWRMVRWVDDPLSGGTGCGDTGPGPVSWGAIKNTPKKVSKQ